MDEQTLREIIREEVKRALVEMGLATDEILIGWEAIAPVMFMKPRTAQSRREELMRAGVLNYIVMTNDRGVRVRRVACTRSKLELWKSLKARKREKL